MKLLKVISSILLAFLGLWTLVALFSPKEIDVSKSITIDREDIEIFNEINDLRNWMQWQDQLKKENLSEIKISNPSKGMGAKIQFTLKEGDWKEVKILESERPKFISNSITFSDNEENKYEWKINAIDKFSCELSLSRNSVPLSFFTRPMGFSKKNELEEEFLIALTSLKMTAENNPKQSKKLAAELGEMENYYLIGKTFTSSKEELENSIGNSYGELLSLCSKMGWEIIGMPISLNYQEKGEEIEMSTAFRLSKNVDAPEGFFNDSISKGLSVSISHFGLYENLPASHEIIKDFMKDNDLIERDSPIEIYVSDPGAVKDSSSWETQIIYPVKHIK